MATRRRTRSRSNPEAQSGSRRTRVQTTRVSRGRDTAEETIRDTDDAEVFKFETDPAYVRVSAGVTRQIRDYESLRVDVAISMPCYKEQVQDTFNEVRERVADFLEQEVNEYLG